MDICTDGATLDTNLADLSPDAIGLIFDFVGARSLFRVLHSGCHRLNTKIYTSVRRFDLVYSHATRFAKWPKHLSSFTTLEHVSVRADDPLCVTHPAIIYEVDLLALPSTLRRLELCFANDLFCLVTLPPLSYVGGPFTPRLRPELKNKFANLERLSWHRNYVDDWNMALWIQDTAAWVLFPIFRTRVVYRSLPEASELPATTSSLDLRLNVNETQPTTLQLPASLQSLRIFQFLDGEIVLKQLTASDLGFLPSLQYLTTLNFGTKTMDKELVSMLPRSLKTLHISTSNAELESFALLPYGLENIAVHYETIFSSTTGERIRDHEVERLENGLPESFLPSMREMVVKKLPTNLKRLSHSIWMLIRPKDWDAFPAKNTAASTCENAAILGPSTLPYVAHLPLCINSLATTSSCTPQVASMLPRHLTELKLRLLSSEWNLPYAPGSAEESEAACTMIQGVFEAISRICALETLALLVDRVFKVDYFVHLNAPLLRNLRLEYHQTEENVIRTGISTHFLENSSETLRCFARLYCLTLDSRVLAAFYDAIPHILQASTELIHLFTDEGGGETSFSPSWLPFLPPKLENLYSTFDIFDHAIIRALPRTLYRLRASSRNMLDGYDLPDLFDLPPRLCYAFLPYPRGNPPTEDSVIAVWNEINKGRVYNTTFFSHPPRRFQPIRWYPPQPPIATILASEHHSRTISTNDYLLPPSRRRKRRAGE